MVYLEGLEGVFLLHKAGEAHEGERQEPSRDERQGNAAEATGRIRMRQLLADAGEDDEREAEADRRRKRIEDGAEEVEVALRVHFGDAQDGAVCGDERQEDAERRMQRRHEALHRDVDELHERGDHEDERQRVDVAEAVWLEEELVQTPGHGGGDRHHENDRAGPAEGRLRLFRHAQKRATTQKAVQDEIVHQNRTYDYDKVAHGKDYTIIRGDLV